MPLTTLQAVKAKLGIPATDTADDAAIQPVLDAVDGYLMGRLGYRFDVGPVTEIIPKPQVGRPIRLSFRPIQSIDLAEVRFLGDGVWTPISTGIYDADRGLVVILPPESTWPPGPRPAPWFQWRQQAWDQLRITYQVQPLSPVPADLADAAATLAAYWFRLQRTGPVSDAHVGEISESYSRDPVPLQVESIISRYEKGSVSWY